MVEKTVVGVTRNRISLINRQNVAQIVQFAALGGAVWLVIDSCCQH
jgi:hypothetical protein